MPDELINWAGFDGHINYEEVLIIRYGPKCKKTIPIYKNDTKSTIDLLVCHGSSL